MPKMMPPDMRRRRAALVISVEALLLLAAAWVVWGLFSAPSAKRPASAKTDAHYGIAPVACSSDQDGDGIDDQRDILSSALTYVETRPVYGSAYYQGGYPDDGKGVCTDVVAAALLGAGYDLRTLVDEDIRTCPQYYDVPVPDSNIDYRRVRNLRVWFDRHAQSLTCDTTQVDQWSGGDIVCYENHIGIVSDLRNAEGMPYLIHNGSRLQRRYEQDRLASYGRVVGHWRMGQTNL